jgi:hypothetical protein
MRKTFGDEVPDIFIHVVLPPEKSVGMDVRAYVGRDEGGGRGRRGEEGRRLSRSRDDKSIHYFDNYIEAGLQA